MKPDQQTTSAEALRSELVAECHSLIVSIAHKPSCLKLLALARNHLRMLAQYKGNRGLERRVR